MDIEKLIMLEKAGAWLTITARDDDGSLVGYAVGVLSPHLHYKSSGPMFMVDMYYIKPEHRNGTGAQLLAFMEATAREKNAIKIYLSCKIHKDHTRLFEALGYKLSDYAFIKRVG